jgi:hypothetical protein
MSEKPQNENLLQIQINLYNCQYKNNAPTLTLIRETLEILIPTNRTICREACFTINETGLPSNIKQLLQNTSGVFTIRENKDFLNACEPEFHKFN